MEEMGGLGRPRGPCCIPWDGLAPCLKQPRGHRGEGMVLWQAAGEATQEVTLEQESRNHLIQMPSGLKGGPSERQSGHL